VSIDRVISACRIAIALVILTASVRATVIVPADLSDLSREARSIARGRVAAVEARWSDDRRTIETLVTLQVDEYLKGPLGDTVQFRVPGGSLGRYRRVFVGAPEFAVDDHVIVFLAAAGPVVPYIIGLSQGVFRLTRSADRSSWVVTPPPMLPAAGGRAVIVRGDESRRPMALAEFTTRVRALAAAAR